MTPDAYDKVARHPNFRGDMKILHSKIIAKELLSTMQ